MMIERMPIDRSIEPWVVRDVGYSPAVWFSTMYFAHCPRKTLDELYEWHKLNCQGRMNVLRGMVVFENEDDAAIFTLRWVK